LFEILIFDKSSHRALQTHIATLYFHTSSGCSLEVFLGVRVGLPDGHAQASKVVTIVSGMHTDDLPALRNRLRLPLVGVTLGRCEPIGVHNDLTIIIEEAHTVDPAQSLVELERHGCDVTRRIDLEVLEISVVLVVRLIRAYLIRPDIAREI